MFGPLQNLKMLVKWRHTYRLTSWRGGLSNLRLPFGPTLRWRQKKIAKEKELPKNSEILVSLMVAEPTKEAKPRVEICGRGEKTSRIFVLNLAPSKCPNWVTLVEDMRKAVQNGGCSKEMLREMKAKFD